MRAELEHCDETGFVECRVVVGRADEARDAAGHGRGHFGFKRRFILMFEARRNIQAIRIDHLGRVKIRQRLADNDDAPRRDEHVLARFCARSRIDDRAVLDLNLHVVLARSL